MKKINRIVLFFSLLISVATVCLFNGDAIGLGLAVKALVPSAVIFFISFGIMIKTEGSEQIESKVYRM